MRGAFIARPLFDFDMKSERRLKSILVQSRLFFERHVSMPQRRLLQSTTFGMAGGEVKDIGVDRGGARCNEGLDCPCPPWQRHRRGVPRRALCRSGWMVHSFMDDTPGQQKTGMGRASLSEAATNEQKEWVWRDALTRCGGTLGENIIVSTGRDGHVCRFRLAANLKCSPNRCSSSFVAAIRLHPPTQPVPLYTVSLLRPPRSKSLHACRLLDWSFLQQLACIHPHTKSSGLDSTLPPP
jgi:hypothetical protein